MERRIELTYEQFCERLKNKKKRAKQQRKQNLRQGTYRKIVQESDDSNEETIKKQGNKWWQKINRNYFKNLAEDYVQNMKQLTTSLDLMEIVETSSYLLPYYQCIIHPNQPYIFHDTTLRIVFRREFRINQVQQIYLVGYTLGIPQQKSTSNQKLQSNQRLLSFHIPTNTTPKSISQEQIKKIASSVDIELVGICTDQFFITKCLEYESIWRRENIDEVDKEILCWEMQLQQQHMLNIKDWEELQARIQMEKILYPPEENIEQQEKQIRKFLMRNETFTYFRGGYCDKTYEELEKALECMKEEEIVLGNQQKKISAFETDCKICFSTKNDPNNRVIYCDDCNTSFHQSCYGIEKISEGQFYCDACAFVREQGTLKLEKPCCQICSRGKFPIKKIHNHFYHISCLILFNFAEIKQFQIKLKPNINYEVIIGSVVVNQLEHGNCQFCTKNANLGMQFVCKDPLCAKSYHPICAYLNGCYFDIRRTETKLMVDVYCQQHHKRQTSLLSQIYMRRFFCNYKKTAKINQEQFIKKYKEETEKRQKLIDKELNEPTARKILKRSKVVKNYLDKNFQSESMREIKSPTKKKQQLKPLKIYTETAQLLKSVKHSAK